MAASPSFKIYDSYGVYQAACKEPEAAACLMGLYGDGSTVRLDHRRTIWTEGPNGDGEAGESYDDSASVMLSRI